MPENPKSQEEIDTKFLSLGTAAVGQKTAESMLGILRGTFAASEVRTIAEQLGHVSLIS